MKKLLILAQIIFLVSCNKDYLSLVEYKIKQTDRQKNSISKTNSQVRKKVFNSGTLNFISAKDTIYIIEDYDIPSATYYSSIWTDLGSLHYGYLNKIEIKNESPFSKKTISLVSNWDIPLIRREEKVNYNQLDPNHLITAYRVYTFQKKTIIDLIKFRPFY